MGNIKKSFLNRFNSIGLNLHCSSNIFNGALSEAIIISAYPRGGSTWLSDVLNQVPRTVSYYEPLNLGYMVELQKLNFASRHHIPQGSEETEVKDFFFKLLIGKLNNIRMTFHPMTKSQDIIDIIRAKRRIYKFCRLNLMLPWLIDTFPELPKPIVLFRHPCAVIASQISFGNKYHGAWSGDINFNTLISQRYSDYFLIHMDKLQTLLSKEEQLAALWCISNKYILEHEYNNKKWITLSYENLLVDYENQIKRLLSELKLDEFGTQIEDYLEKNQLSKTSLRSHAINKVDQLNDWKTALTSSQIHKILRVVEQFDLTKYYDESLEPNYKNIYNL